MQTAALHELVGQTHRAALTAQTAIGSASPEIPLSDAARALKSSVTALDDELRVLAPKAASLDDATRERFGDAELATQLLLYASHSLENDLSGHNVHESIDLAISLLSPAKTAVE